ncbi:hypothetical protein [Crenobacter intestini]|uniref:Uncharacterized protein n=1 Tax=Crenobacter intestini TaxID=2563443 RepID=A0A4V4N6Z1_9NEIS|nr:hypothetical protein [Crenobacter intestini]TIC78543.1 hypothetical protein E5K04_15615 [Crenobacter intestini]
MSTLTNFPHKLLVLQTALRMNRLAINTELSGAGEKDLVAALICFLDSADYTRPITAHRKKIADFADLAKTSFFKILGNLRKKGIIEPMGDDKTLRFTAKGAALLAEKIESRPTDAKTGLPEGFFRVGRFTLPRPSMSLLDRGVQPIQIATLLREAKRLGVNLQQRLKEFGQLITRYSGENLFLVFRSFLKEPEKYRQHVQAANAIKQLTQSQRLLLHRIADGSLPLLASGETLRSEGNTFVLGRPEVQGGAPQPVSEGDLLRFEQRARRACEHARHAGEQTAVATAAEDWFEQFARLPEADQILAENKPRHVSEGRYFERAGIQYKVELVEGERVTLLEFGQGQQVRVAYRSLADLNCSRIRWLDEEGGSRGEQY